MDRVKNTKRNIIYGAFNQCITLVLPFIVRTVIIKKLGIDYLGLNSLFGSILQVLNLAELGIGNAIVYHMYKPIVENDKKAICALMHLYRKIYRIIGLIIFAGGILLLPILPKIIKGDYPSEINIYILFIIYLINTVLSYWMFAYKGALLNAFHRTDIISNISTVTRIGLYILQISVLYMLEDYYFFLLAMPVCTIINNVIIAITTNILFPEYKCGGMLDKKEINQIIESVKGITLYKICQTSRNTFDSIFISAFLGLEAIAMYTNYYYITYSVTAIVSVISSSMLAGVGNSIAAESVEKNYLDFKKFNFLYMWLGGWCTICLLSLMQPFMKIWVGEKMMFNYKVVIFMCIYFYLLKMGEIKAVYSDAAGLWWENRYRTAIETIVNIILNLLLVKIWGIYGIILATIVTLFFLGFGMGTEILFRSYFKNAKLKDCFLLHFQFAMATCIAGLITVYLCEQIGIDGFVGIFYRGCICCIVPNLLYYTIWHKTKIYKESIPWLLLQLHIKCNNNQKDKG